jgi:hypothetical protein
MATVAGIKIKPKTKKVTSESIREYAKRDHSPKWDNVDTMTSDEYAKHFRSAMKYYNMESSNKDLKPKVIDWMGRNGYDKSTIQSFKKTKDWRCQLTTGAIAASLIKGMPDVREGFNQGKSAVEWLKKEIDKIIDEGKYDIEEIIEVKGEKQAAPVVNIQDRIREQAVTMSDELDAAIDEWITDPEAFNPKDIKIINLLKGKGAKAAQARYIKGFFAKGLAELQELSSGNADEQLKEGYKHVNRKNIKKLIEFYEGIAQACEQIAAEAKVMKKPRAKKIKPAEELVNKLKFMLSDTKLGITSVPPAGIIGSQSVVVYNTKTRKLGYYIASSSAGLSVKGTSITDFTAMSVQRTLRKPDVQIKEFKEQNTQKRVETWFSKIKTTETTLNGRMSEDTIILKVFK